MATTERPKSRLEDGRVNPAYTAWRKAQREAEIEDAFVPPEGPEDTPKLRGLGPWINHSPSEDFQSAAEPEQTTNDDPREPEVAPALEASLPEEVDSDAGSSPAPASDGETLSLMVIREARNSKFVLCALDKRKVAVRLLKRGTGPKLVKKHIKVQCVRKNFIQVP